MMRTRIFDVCVACCAALTLFAAGCDSSKGDGGSEGESGGESSSEESEGRQGEPPIEQETYVEAAVDITCVDKHLGDEVDLARIKEDVFGNYEVREEKYKKAEEYFSTPKKKDDEDDEDDEEMTDTEKEINDLLEEECSEPKARMIAGQAPIEKETYVDTTFELSCIEEELGEDIDMEETEKKFYDRKDISAEAYDMAEEFFSDKEDINDTIKSRMEDDCTKANARSYAGLEEPGPAYTGSLSGSVSGQAGFGKAQLRITVSDDFSASGKMSGKREGNGFRIPLEGKVSKNNNLSLSGSSGQNNVEVSGKLTSGGTRANVSGSLFGRDFNVTINAN